MAPLFDDSSLAAASEGFVFFVMRNEDYPFLVVGSHDHTLLKFDTDLPQHLQKSLDDYFEAHNIKSGPSSAIWHFKHKFEDAFDDTDAINACYWRDVDPLTFYRHVKTLAAIDDDVLDMWFVTLKYQLKERWYYTAFLIPPFTTIPDVFPSALFKDAHLHEDGPFLFHGMWWYGSDLMAKFASAGFWLDTIESSPTEYMDEPRSSFAIYSPEGLMLSEHVQEAIALRVYLSFAANSDGSFTLRHMQRFLSAYPSQHLYSTAS